MDGLLLVPPAPAVPAEVAGFDFGFHHSPVPMQSSLLRGRGRELTKPDTTMPRWGAVVHNLPARSSWRIKKAPRKWLGVWQVNNKTGPWFATGCQPPVEVCPEGPGLGLSRCLGPGWMPMIIEGPCYDLTLARKSLPMSNPYWHTSLVTSAVKTAVIQYAHLMND